MTQGVQILRRPAVGVGPGGLVPSINREVRIVETFVATLDELSAKLGPDMAQCNGASYIVYRSSMSFPRAATWGQLLDHGGEPVSGDMMTVGNTGSGPDFTATSGAGYRLIADFSAAIPNASGR